MRRLAIDEASCPEELRAGLEELEAGRPERFGGEGAVTLKFARTEDAGLAATWGDGEVEIAYGDPCDAFRAVGRLLGEADPAGQDFAETRWFDTIGVMADMSRNGVLTVEAAKQMLRRCALMGVNMFMLYTEDTYEVPGEPFFGYLRGPYTQEELRTLDAYAATLGIEMVPCIQTLAHLEQILQWPAYSDLRDVGGVIIAEEERTYELVEKLIEAATAPFRSNRIHLGMDEAHGIGTGRYRRRHGEKSSFEILNTHLARVRDICAERGLQPMMWSDMYFRLGSESNDYYDLEADIPDGAVADRPKDVQLVYWDYYHTDTEFYERMIELHRGMEAEPIMAGGVWTWNHMWAALPYAFSTTEACMTACKAQSLREAFVTLWGDDGMECDIFSALPGIQFFAEHAYAETVEPKRLRANFRGACEAEFDDWVRAAEIDSLPCLSDPAHSRTNAGKWLLWQDPILGFLDPLVEGVPLRSHYEELAEELAEAAEADEFSARLHFPEQIARVLSIKCHLRRHLAAAYRDGDKTRLRGLMQGALADLRCETEKLWKRHRDMWLSTYKPFGLEVIECRYGGLLARLETLADRLEAYLEGRAEAIPEFEVELQKLYPRAPAELPTLSYARAATPSCIK